MTSPSKFSALEQKKHTHNGKRDHFRFMRGFLACTSTILLFVGSFWFGTVFQLLLAFLGACLNCFMCFKYSYQWRKVGGLAGAVGISCLIWGLTYGLVYSGKVPGFGGFELLWWMLDFAYCLLFLPIFLLSQKISIVDRIFKVTNILLWGLSLLTLSGYIGVLIRLHNCVLQHCSL